MADTPKRRARRQFTDEFKAGVVRLVLEEGKAVGAVARDMDLTETAVREWVKRARADRTHGRTGLTTAEREELARLRKENRELRTERDQFGRDCCWTRVRIMSFPTSLISATSVALARRTRVAPCELNALLTWEAAAR
jgi:transposase